TCYQDSMQTRVSVMSYGEQGYAVCEVTRTETQRFPLLRCKLNGSEGVRSIPEVYTLAGSTVCSKDLRISGTSSYSASSYSCWRVYNYAMPPARRGSWRSRLSSVAWACFWPRSGHSLVRTLRCYLGWQSTLRRSGSSLS